MSSRKMPLERSLTLAEQLLSRFLNELTGPNTATSTFQDPPPVLPLLADSARLLKAQVTKLSLLAISKPFTPSAISSVVHDTTSTCLPAMMSAVQICHSQGDLYASFFADEVQARVRRIMREMLGVINEVSAISKDASSDGPTTTRKSRDSLSATGVVWSGCDELTALATSGLSGLAVQKAEAYRDMIKDAIAELQEWREGDDLENEGQGDGLLDSDDEGVDGDRESLEDMFNASNSLPADRDDLRELVTIAEEKLKKVVILYTALIKRRLKPLPKDRGGLTSADAQQRVDQTADLLRALPQKVDELASVLYDLDADGAKTCLDDILKKANQCTDIASLSYEDKEDEFTAWTVKWREAIR